MRKIFIFLIILVMTLFNQEKAYSAEHENVDVKINISSARVDDTKTTIGSDKLEIYDNDEKLLEVEGSVEVKIIDGEIDISNKYGESLYRYKDNDEMFITSYNEKFGYNAIKIDGKEYRGKVYFKIIDNKLLTINRLDLEDYLKGVVANEMPYEWKEEALKAQAVAARTYALSNIRENNVYDMEDDQRSQVYNGLLSERESTNEAVEETRGKAIYYENKLITAYYHSTSGGVTENSENVWTAEIPYLKGVDDKYSYNSPHTNWIEIITSDELLESIRNTGEDVKEIYDFEITKYSDNGRVLEAYVETDIGTLKFVKEEIRRLLGLKSNYFTLIEPDMTPKSSGISLISSGGKITDNVDLREKKAIKEKGIIDKINDTITIISEKSKKAVIELINIINNLGKNGYRIEGKGWGHGVGLSQWGAYGMARDGFTYEEILKHYYTGVEIK